MNHTLFCYFGFERRRLIDSRAFRERHVCMVRVWVRGHVFSKRNLTVDLHTHLCTQATLPLVSSHIKSRFFFSIGWFSKRLRTDWREFFAQCFISRSLLKIIISWRKSKMIHHTASSSSPSSSSLSKSFSVCVVSVAALMILVCHLPPAVEANMDAKRLYDDLISRYNKLVIPVMNVSEPITVHIKLKLSQLIEVNLKDQIMTTNLWVEQVISLCYINICF